jgi:hypothetical protein
MQASAKHQRHFAMTNYTSPSASEGERGDALIKTFDIFTKW